MSQRIKTFLEDFSRCSGEDRALLAEALRRAQWFCSADDAEVQQFFEELLARPASALNSAQSRLINESLTKLAQGFIERGASGGVSDWLPSRLKVLYVHYRETTIDRFHLLRILSSHRTEKDLTTLADLIADDPPQDEVQAGLVFSPLFQHLDFAGGALFPRLLDGVVHLSVAATILDLANHLTRRRKLHPHPATPRAARLADLLGQLCARLGKLEEEPPGQTSGENISRTVVEGAALAVSLCDTLALIGDGRYVGKLYQALDLRHRRIRTEAANALAVLGEEAGKEALVELAREPVARLRVLAYADELGITDNINAEFRSAAARAEAELASWLSEPTQYGIPPSEMELIDQREQFWPSFDEPQECFLFRFRYQLGGAGFENIGIAGPFTGAAAADLTVLSIEDVYALFAGWQSEHDEISETGVEHVAKFEAHHIEQLRRRLASGGYQQIQPHVLGSFFGQRVLIAQAIQVDVPVLAVADEERTWSVPLADNNRALTPSQVFCIDTGRKLLQMFNA